MKHSVSFASLCLAATTLLSGCKVAHISDYQTTCRPISTTFSQYASCLESEHAKAEGIPADEKDFQSHYVELAKSLALKVDGKTLSEDDANNTLNEELNRFNEALQLKRKQARANTGRSQTEW